MKIYIETLGCQMNRLDSELAEGALRAAGHAIVHDARRADAVLYNTCSVRQHAEEKVYSRLGADGQRKAEGRPLVVAVLGCMAQREGEELRKRFPHVDVVCAPGQLHRLAELLERAAGGTATVALDPPRGRGKSRGEEPPQSPRREEDEEKAEKRKDASARLGGLEQGDRHLRGEKHAAPEPVPVFEADASAPEPVPVFEADASAPAADGADPPAPIQNRRSVTVHGTGQTGCHPQAACGSRLGGVEPALPQHPQAAERRRLRVAPGERLQESRIETPPPSPSAVSAVKGSATDAHPDGIDALDLGRDASGTPSASQAFVRIQRGCDNFCSYCIVPFVRGSERSRDPAHVVEEVGRLLDAGRSEITLLGQTVNRYHWRTGETSVRFSDLLERLSPLAGLRRLRFVTSHPLGFTDDVLEAMRDLPNVCEYIHCPAQSGSDAMLKAMNRGYTRGQYDDFIARARAIVPEAVLAGDFIVGFPGETEADHEASAELIRRCGYKNSFIFKYSPRPGTHAAERMADDVPVSVKKRRNNELLAVQEQVGTEHHARYVGRTVEVLVEGPSRRSLKQPCPAPAGCVQLVGRTRGDHIVVFDGAKGLANTYAQVRITGSNALTLFGEVRG